MCSSRTVISRIAGYLVVRTTGQCTPATSALYLVVNPTTGQVDGCLAGISWPVICPVVPWLFSTTASIYCCANTYYLCANSLSFYFDSRWHKRQMYHRWSAHVALNLSMLQTLCALLPQARMHCLDEQMLSTLCECNIIVVLPYCVIIKLSSVLWISLITRDFATKAKFTIC